MRHPGWSLETGGYALERDLSLNEIIRRKGYAPPSTEVDKDGCAMAAGISEHNGQPILLLPITNWGRMAEVPHKGVLFLPLDVASKLAAPGKCAVLTASVSGGGG